LWSWGYNDFGRLGHNDTVSRSSPVQVGGLTGWAFASAGGQHTVAIKTNGTLWAWGANGSLGAGRLGDGTETTRSSPVQIGGLTNWVQAFAARNNSVGRLSNTEVFAWGSGANGRLGDNTVVNKSSPALVGSGFASISAHNASHTLAIKTNGTLFAWGYQGGLGTPLGDGTDASRSSPVQIGALTNWSQVSAGRYTSSAIKTDGTLWAWGNNNNGKLGDNTITPRSSPIQIGSETTWLQSDLGDLHTLAILKGS
jgi:alpha-tubulin suppressor-like RCC1 family protein